MSEATGQPQPQDVQPASVLESEDPMYLGFGADRHGVIWHRWERRKGKAAVLGATWAVQKLSRHGAGYSVFVLPRLRGAARSRQIYAHRLVASCFHGPCPEGLEVCHNDGNPANNRPDNLRYGTRSANIMDSVRHGTHVDSQGEKHPRAKLREADVRWIKSTAGMISNLTVAMAFGVSPATISNIRTGTRWSHVKTYAEMGEGC